MLDSPGVLAAVLASRFARELELPYGNFWEPGIADRIEADIREGLPLDAIEDDWRLRLGLKRTEPGGVINGKA